MPDCAEDLDAFQDSSCIEVADERNDHDGNSGQGDVVSGHCVSRVAQ